MSERKTIFRVPRRTRPFVMVSQAMARDKKISAAARGSLLMIMSYPDDWEFDFEWFAEQMCFGRDKAQSILRELAEFGYCKRDRVRYSDGTWGPYEYIFSDEPERLEGEKVPASKGKEEPQPENPVMDNHNRETSNWKPVTGEPALANPHLPYNKKDDEYCPEETPLPPKGGTTPRGKTGLPADWKLSPQLRQWSIVKRPEIADRLDDEEETFRDYWRGHDRRMKDWEATWRNWWKRAKAPAHRQTDRERRDAEFLRMTREMSAQRAAQ